MVLRVRALKNKPIIPKKVYTDKERVQAFAEHILEVCKKHKFIILGGGGGDSLDVVDEAFGIHCLSDGTFESLYDEMFRNLKAGLNGIDFE